MWWFAFSNIPDTCCITPQKAIFPEGFNNKNQNPVNLSFSFSLSLCSCLLPFPFLSSPVFSFRLLLAFSFLPVFLLKLTHLLIYNQSPKRCCQKKQECQYWILMDSTDIHWMFNMSWVWPGLWDTAFKQSKQILASLNLHAYRERGEEIDKEHT